MSRSIIKILSASACLATLPLATAVHAVTVQGTEFIDHYDTAEIKEIIHKMNCKTNENLFLLLSGCDYKKNVKKAIEALALPAPTNTNGSGYGGGYGSNSKYPSGVVTVVWLAKTGDQGYGFGSSNKSDEYAILKHEIVFGKSNGYQGLLSSFTHRIKTHNNEYPHAIEWLTEHMNKINTHWVRKVIRNVNNDEIDAQKIYVYKGKLNACHLTQIQNKIVSTNGINSLWNNPLFTTQIATVTGSHDPDNTHKYDVAAIFDASDANCADYKSLTAQSDIMSISEAATLQPGESLSIGHNNTPITPDSTSRPAALEAGSRLGRDWHYSEQGDNGIESVTVGINLNHVEGIDAGNSLAGNYILLINNGGTDYTNAVLHTAGRTITNGKVSFTGVPVDDGQHVTLLVDYLADDDNDGIANIIEIKEGSDQSDQNSLPDRDSNGTQNNLDNDADGDDVSNIVEFLNVDPYGDADNDGIPNYLDATNNGTNVSCIDTDNDDFCDTWPTELDKDQDGFVDFLDDDTQGGGDDNNGGGDDNDDNNDDNNDNNDNGDDTFDPTDDYDQDGLTNGTECPDYPTCIDSDGDGLVNYMDKDDDNDGILTQNELGDTDGDTMPDYLEPNGADFDQDGLYNHNDSYDDGDNNPTATEVGDDPLNPLDIDADNIPDYLDPDSTNDANTPDGSGDSDNDGVSDAMECASWPCIDTDSDGIPNHMDGDDDGDLINTNLEYKDKDDNVLDNDGDTVPDYLEPNDLNTDGDKDINDLPIYNNMDADDDGDGIFTEDEVGNPVAPDDVDGDNIPDYLDADTNNSGGTLDGSGDSDQDGLSDLFECPTGPCVDTDGDAIPNYMDSDDDNDNINTADEPGDTDGDTVPDYLEPNNVDTDGNGAPDVEDADDDGDNIDTAAETGSNPLDPIDFNNDGTPDYLDGDNQANVDTDGDGITDIIECPRQPCVDSDGDNAPNFNDANDDNDSTGTADELTPQDTDGDRLPDYLDSDVIDTDQDGVSNQLDSDDDGDGRPTADELGPDVLYPLDQDNDQIPDYLDVDSTNEAGTVDGSGDSDQDGLPDIQECSSRPCEDSNGDGLPDYLDPNTPDRNLGNGNGNFVEPIRTNTDTIGGSMGLFFGLGLALMLASRKQTPTKVAKKTVGNNINTMTSTTSNTISNNRSKTPMRTPVAGSIAGIIAALTCTNAVGEIWQLDNFYDSQKEETQVTQTAAATSTMDPQLTESDNLSVNTDSVSDDDTTATQSRRFYVGGAIGLTQLRPETENTGFRVSDDSDAGVKVLGGIQWNEKLFFETSFNLLGSSQVAFNNQTAEIDYQVFSFDALYKLPQFLPEKFSTFGILGLTALDTDSDVPVEQEANIQVKAGVALEYMLQNDWAVRSTMEKFSGDTAFVSAGIVKYIGDQDEAPKEPAFDLAQAAPVADIDSDGDGVFDRYDACPGTRLGLSVDARGCGIFNRSFSNITFETNSTRLTREARAVIDELALELKKVPHLLVEVQAHTDNVGTASYNVWLSNKRAEAIIDYLRRHNIPADRLQPRGFGETNPIASNDTEFGRSENRRAEFRVLTEK